MSLKDNPIFLTQKRLVYRGGLLAAIAIAALVGGSLLSGLIAYLVRPDEFSFHSSREAGMIFYAWIVGLETIILVIGGANRVSQSLGNDRKNGLWDSNRLTPLRPWQLVTGYWFGSPLREFYMAVVLAAAGLVIVLAARLSPTLWLGTQVLILSTALFFGLMAVLAGLVFQKPQAGASFLVALIFLQFPAMALPKYSVTNFLLPVQPIASLFQVQTDSGPNESMHEWIGTPTLFGASIYPVLLSLVLQTAVGIFLWRAAVRKTANPFRPPLLCGEAVALFSILLLTQHALMWSTWGGYFPNSAEHRFMTDWSSLLAVVHAATLALAAVVLVANSPQPESIRLGTLRSGVKDFKTIFAESSVSLALILAAISAAILATQFIHSDMWGVYLVAVGNLFCVFVVFALLLEYCRLRYGRRAPGFIALGLFVLCLLPFVLALVFSNSAIARTSLLAPGVTALANSDDENLGRLGGIIFAHIGIAFLLFLAWLRQWERLLAKAV